MYFCYLCAAIRYICLSGRLGPCVCQDAPSFGNSLSRCSIFCQVTLLSSVCVCGCVWAFGSWYKSGWSILWQQPVKMLHLSSGDPFVLCVCMCVYMCVCLSVWVLNCVCQDTPSFGNSLSRCSIFRQVTLLSSVCMCVYMCVCLGVWVLVYVRMLHPSATACQDVPSFVR